MLKKIAPKELTILELDTMGEPRNGPVQQELQRISGVITVPQVYVNGKYIGSDEQIKALDAAGELRKTLTEAGAAM